MTTKKVKLSEIRGLVREVINERAAHTNKQLIENILAEKEGFLSNLASKIGMSNPSKDVDNPKHVEGNLQKAFDAVNDLGKKFSDRTLRSTKEINSYHEALVNMLDKVTSLSDTLGPERSKAFNSQMVHAAREFYKNLKNEVDRIDSFLKTVRGDLKAKGIDPSKVYGDTSGLKKKVKAEPAPAFKVKRPGDMVANGTGVEDDEIEKMIGGKPTWMDDEPKNAGADVDDDEALKNAGVKKRKAG